MLDPISLPSSSHGLLLETHSATPSYNQLLLLSPASNLHTLAKVFLIPYFSHCALPTDPLLPLQAITSPSFNSQCSSTSSQHSQHPPHSHEPAASASLLTSIVLVVQLPTSTLPLSIHCLLTSFRSLSSTLFSSAPFTPPQPSSTNDFSKSFCQLLFFSIWMASSTTHLINLFSLIFTTFIQNSIHLLIASYTNSIILISYSVALLGCSLSTPQQDLVARSCTWTSGSVCLQHPHTSAPYSNTESTKASNNLKRTLPSPHQWLFYISSATLRGLLLPPLLYSSPLLYTLHIHW